MATNEQDARALTFLACRIRKETHGAKTWDEAGTYAVVARLIGTHLSTAIEQVTRHAADPEARTPGAIMRPFTPAAVEAPKRGAFPPKKSEECRKHLGQLPPPYCAACATENVKAYYDSEEDPVPTDPMTTTPAAIREQLRKVKA